MTIEEKIKAKEEELAKLRESLKEEQLQKEKDKAYNNALSDALKTVGKVLETKYGKDSGFVKSITDINTFNTIAKTYHKLEPYCECDLTSSIKVNDKPARVKHAHKKGTFAEVDEIISDFLDELLD